MHLRHVAVGVALGVCSAFAPPRRITTRPSLRKGTAFDEARDEFLKENQFDALSLRQWRRETLVRYSNANQSEPLRILLSLLLAVSLLFAAPLADAVGAPTPEPIAAYYLGGLGSAALFARERGRRTKRLLKIERECAVGDITVTLRPAAAAVFPGLSSTATLRSLRNSARVVATLCADEADFLAFSRTVRGLRRRLAASRTVALGVTGAGATDDSAPCSPRDGRELADAFRALLTTDEAWGDFDFATKQAAWFALSFKGRSVGSGTGAPDLLELLGSLLPPRDVMAAEPLLAGGTPLLDAQKAFYAALTSGDLAAMEGLLAPDEFPAVTAAVEAGARVDPWPSQLKDGARPADLVVGDADETYFSDGAAPATEANAVAGMTTAIEETGNFQTLLAVQRWTKVGGAWKLASHETIPFATGTQAGAVLKCDCRGCIALVRRQRGQLRE